MIDRSALVRARRRWGRPAALSLASARVALGVGAILMPERAGRLWIGPGADGADRAVVLRALGGRDVALGVGALMVRRDNAELGRWVAMGVLSDLVDAGATLVGFGSIPAGRRWMVLLASAGAAAFAATVVPVLKRPS